MCAICAGGVPVRYEHLYFDNGTLVAVRVKDPDQYGPFFNARISKERRSRLETAYIAYRNDVEIGMVWSTTQWWSTEKAWHWLTPGLSVSRRSASKLYRALWLLSEHESLRQRRTRRQQEAERELADALIGIDFRV